MSSPPNQTTTTADLGAVVEAIRARDRFLVTTHENPDGDALGSLLATHLALRSLGKDSVMFLAGPAPLPGEYRFLRLEELQRELPADTVGRDADRRRLREREPARRRPGRPPPVAFTVNIDHHHDNSRFGDLNLVDPGASSTSEVLRGVFAELGVELTPELAEPLYVALVTDTGRFQYANTTPKALRLAAEPSGGRRGRAQGLPGCTRASSSLKLLTRALERAQVYEGGGLVVSYLLRDDFAEVGAVEPYSEGIIDFLRAVEARTWPRSSASRRVGGARPGGSRCEPHTTSWTSPRSRAPPGAAGTGRRALERRLDRGDHRLPAAEFSAAAAGAVAPG